MKALFADTFFFFAFLNAEDGAHEEAEAYFESFNGQLVTTEWVLTELADGMAGPGDREVFTQFHEALRSDEAITVVPSTTALFAAGVRLYSARTDKEWTLTDCISFVVMQHEGLAEVLSGDRHFEQAGFKTLLKS
jgi:predicted nucleic acid-binding protein